LLNICISNIFSYFVSCLFFLFLAFETASHYVSPAGLELTRYPHLVWPGTHDSPTLAFFFKTVAWTQGLHLEPLKPPIFVKGFLR
jgi:hypothetical protein